MRVLIGSALYPTPRAPRTVGGAEIFARDLARRIAAGGGQVTAVRAAGPGVPDREEAEGVAVRALAGRNVAAPFPLPRDPVRRLVWHVLDDWTGDTAGLARLVREARPDVVHTNTLSGLTTRLWRAARDAGVPVVHTLHDYYLTCPRCARFARGAPCAGTCTACRLLTVRRRRACALVDAVVGVSRRILDLHLDAGLFARARIRTVVRNAASAAGLSPGPRYAGGPVRIGFIGRPAPEKGLDRLAAAMAGIGPARARLVVAGRFAPPEIDRLRALAEGAEIVFLGFIAPADFYAQVDLVAAPSLWEEPAALAVVEALAAGRPVLGSPLGGTPELVRDGETGWIVPPTVPDLSAALARILAEPGALPDRQAAAAAAGGARGFDDVVAEYGALYARLARAVGPGVEPAAA